MRDRSMVTRCSGAVLAGGRSRRMGRDKASMVVGGVTLLQRAVATLQAVCDEVMVVVARDSAPAGLPPDVRIVVDRVPDAGPLGGLEAALAAAIHELVVVVAVDMPDLSDAVLSAQLAMAETHPDLEAITLPRQGFPGGEPLHAVYRRATLPRVTALLASGERRMGATLAGLRVGKLPAETLGRLDPRDVSARNLNTPEERPAP
ncbi:MAG TPA: molybdenum cofactor guanylyltransferase [Candidatus Limnocylindria bacterium]